MRELPPMPTSLVGSYAQPNWLIDKDRLGHRLPPRVRLNELWQVPDERLADAAPGVGRRGPRRGDAGAGGR